MTKDILELESQKMSSDTFIDEIKNNYLSIFESTFNIFEIVKKDLKLNSKLEKDLKC